MRTLQFSSKTNSKQKFQKLSDTIREAIRSGKAAPGEKLPSLNELARQFQMHRHTVLRALEELVAEGWVQSEKRRFYQVTDDLPEKYLRPVKNNSAGPVSSLLSVSRKVEIPFVEEHTAYKHSFPCGHPDLRLFPLREFKSHLYDALGSKNILHYGFPGGHPDLIDQVKQYLRRVRQIDGREILITNGSQEAIFLLAQSFLRPGDAVAVEALGYPPAVEALRYTGAKIVPIAVDENGLVVDELAKKLATQKIKMLYTTPLHQYPTTVTLSAARRLQLYELAVKNHIAILEDDYDHEFHYISQPVAPLASFDPAGIVLYVSTFSKILFPSARVGFLAVPPQHAEAIQKLKKISSRQNEQILQVTIAKWMQSGGFEKHLRKMRRVYHARRDAMCLELEKLKSNTPVSWIAPDGGMALWLNTDQDSKRIAEHGKKSSLLLNPESQFRFDRVKTGTHLRLGFSGFTETENRESLKLLFSLFPIQC